MTIRQSGAQQMTGQVAGLHVAQRQRLALSTQMRQQLQLLHMSGTDLNRFIASTMERNPLLKKQVSQASAPHNGQMSSTDGRSQDFSVLDWIDKKSYSQSPTLQEHLREQIIFSFSDRQEQRIALYLSAFLDEKGYFEGELHLIAHELEVSPDLVASVFERCQNFDPPGLFARSLAHCLELQLKRRRLFDPIFAQLLQGLALIVRRDFVRLAKICAITQDELKSRLEIIKRLNPKPGLAFAASHTGAETPALIIADAFIEAQEKDQYRIILNDALLPKLILDRDYSHIIGTTKKERQFINNCRHEANWLIRALEARAQTLLRVISSVMAIQKDFLARGAMGLKPLTLAHIASATRLHESTISRAIAHKYVTIRQNQTELGPYRLNYFFSNALHCRNDEEATSARAIEARLIQLIAAEQAPLSDAALTQLLTEQGIVIARRTVTKYRERLRIAPAYQRRRAKL